jgi:hypothetical protein
MRSELKLCSYSFESVVAAVLRLRVPAVPQHQMAAWFDGGHAGEAAEGKAWDGCRACEEGRGAVMLRTSLAGLQQAPPNRPRTRVDRPAPRAGGRWRCLARLGQRCRLVLRLMDTLDLVGRTAELARCAAARQSGGSPQGQQRGARAPPSSRERCAVPASQRSAFAPHTYARGGLQPGGHTHAHPPPYPAPVKTSPRRQDVWHRLFLGAVPRLPVPRGVADGAAGAQPELPCNIALPGAGAAAGGRRVEMRQAWHARD